ncbi:LysM peptidoglycan-binding domain-containing protein [Flavobacterium agricola]|uniref:LysM peptidoglycan-binding domain-containing protein n=1 Tax=Flavobacterium agricola TaxID=2870839 RepID=A0ABY6M0N2_9FLAO|nr:GDSL-type esterase/lipase family protein [Flavobacterium agricola]UYW01377.1 LysM peptidoglycan-binding domain-containing protein [Flavobacterium agricola]
MPFKNCICIFVFSIILSTYAQPFQDLIAEPVAADSAFISPLQPEPTNDPIVNAAALNSFFKQLQDLETTQKGKVRIVQVGDSHIQADFLTNAAKADLQQKFGNGGLGFVFPHKLAKTNGPNTITYKTNAMFTSSRNVRPVDEHPIGIAGYLLFTTNKNSAIEVTIRNEQDYVNTIKLIQPNNNRFFDVGLSTGKLIPFQNYASKPITHKVKAGETLSAIARNYKTTVDFIKKNNGLKSNTIAIGKVLKVGNEQQVIIDINTSDFEIIDLKNDGTSYAYNSDKLLSTFYLIPNQVGNEYFINGLVLENNKSGITYSGIGVNGAKLSDYNKFDLFFEQMQALAPNLLIVSFGTNESFDKVSVTDFMNQLEIFTTKVKQNNPNVAILVTTPPPSTLYKKYENTYINEYTQALVAFAQTSNKIAVFDMYHAMGGKQGVQQSKEKGFLAKDEVHYTKAGYEQQGKVLADALLQAYQNYISNK